MAGIGFNLQKIMEDDSFGAVIKAHFYSTLIVAGPWLLSILTITVLNALISNRVDVRDMIYFRSVIIYVFVFSLVVVGFIHFPLTRYLSDRIYAKEKDSIVPIFVTASAAVLIVQAVLGAVYCVTVPGPLLLKILSVFIYMAISLIWLLMVFLTALRDYQAITVSYAIGTAVAIGASFYLGKTIGLEGYFLGYLLGHVVIVVLWAARIFLEFSSSRVWDADFFRFMFNNKRLICIGFFYNLAIWIDKIVLWLSPQATKITDFFRTHLIYDSAMFFAFLTIIPALSIFLLQIETEFYTHYRNFYLGIMSKAPYSRIVALKEEILRTLRESLVLLLGFQGMLSIFAIVLAPQLAVILKFSAVQVPVFRIAVLGAFVHSLFLMTLIITLYFDFQGAAFRMTGIFVVTNALFTFITTHLDITFLGYGYLASAMVSLAAAFYMLDAKLARLEYFTFAGQPVGVHREEEMGEVEPAKETSSV